MRLISLLAGSLLLAACGGGGDPDDAKWRIDDAALVQRVERLSAAGEIDAAQGVFTALAQRGATGSVGEQRARLALARALIGLQRGPEALPHLRGIVWADKDPAIAATVLGLEAAVHWQRLLPDGRLISGALPARASADAPHGAPEGRWRERHDAYRALADVLDRGMRLVQAEGGVPQLPAPEPLLALARYAYGDLDAAQLAARLGAPASWTPVVAAAAVRVHLAEHAIDEAMAIAESLWDRHPADPAAGEAYRLLRIWQLGRQRASGLRLWTWPEFDRRLDAIAVLRPVDAAAALAAVADETDLNEMAVQEAISVAVATEKPSVDVDESTSVTLEPAFAIASTWKGLRATVPAVIDGGTPVRIALTSEHRGAHRVEVRRFTDTAAWEACVALPGRERLPEVPVVVRELEIGAWADLGQADSATCDLGALPAGLYAATITARGCPVVAVAGFTVAEVDLRTIAGRDGIVAWAVGRPHGRAAADVPLSAVFRLVRQPEAAAGEEWMRMDDAWRAGFRTAFLGVEDAAWRSREAEASHAAGRAAGAAAAVADPARREVVTVRSGADGLARIPLPTGFAGRGWSARVAVDRTDAAVACTVSGLPVAGWKPTWLAWCDKPAARPGETLRFKVLLREWDGEAWRRPQGSMPVAIEHGYGPAAVRLFAADMAVSDVGTLSGELELPPGLAEGDLRLVIDGANRVLAEVMATRLPAAVIALDEGAPQVAAGSLRPVIAQVRSAAGEPMPGVQVSVRVSVSGLADGKELPGTSESATTDAEGRIAVNVPTARGIEAVYRAQVSAEAAQQRIAACTDWIATDFPVPLEATLLERELIDGDPVRLRLKLPAGAVVQVSLEQAGTALVPLAVTGTGAWQEVTVIAIAKVDALRIEAARLDGGTANRRLPLTVAAAPVVAAGDVRCVPAATRVVPGSELPVVIGCTGTGRDALLLGGSAGVHEARVVHLDGPATSVRLPVAASWAPDLELTACVWLPGRGFTSSPRTRVSVLPVDRLLAVESVAVEPDLRPGDDAEIAVTVRDWRGAPVAGASVSLALVDERLFALHGDETPDLLRWFTAQHREWSLGEGEPELLPALNAELWRSVARRWTPGGAFMGMRGASHGGGRHRAVGKGGGSRGLVPAAMALPESDPTLHWSADLRTAADGTARVRLRTPGVPGRFRITARANDASAAVLVGEVRGELAVREPVGIAIGAPTCAGAGDSLALAIDLTSRLPTAAPVAVRVFAGDRVLAEATTEAVPGQRRHISLPIIVPEAAGRILRSGDLLGRGLRLRVEALPGGIARPTIAHHDLLVALSGTPEVSALHEQVGADGRLARPLAPAGAHVWLRLRTWADAAARRAEELAEWRRQPGARGALAWLRAEPGPQRTDELARRWPGLDGVAGLAVRLQAARGGDPFTAWDALPDGGIGYWLSACARDLGAPVVDESKAGKDTALPVIAARLRLGRPGAARAWMAVRGSIGPASDALDLCFALDAARTAGDAASEARLIALLAQAPWDTELAAVLAEDLLPRTAAAAAPAVGPVLVWGGQRQQLAAGAWTEWSGTLDAPLLLTAAPGTLFAADLVVQTTRPVPSATLLAQNGGAFEPVAALPIGVPAALVLERPQGGWPERLVLPSLVRLAPATGSIRVLRRTEDAWALPAESPGEPLADRLLRLEHLALPVVDEQQAHGADGATLDGSLRVVDLPTGDPDRLLLLVETRAIGTCAWTGGTLSVIADLPPAPPAPPFPLAARLAERLAAATPEERDMLLASEPRSAETWDGLLRLTDPTAAHDLDLLQLHPACGRRGHWSTLAVQRWIEADADIEALNASADSMSAVIDAVIASRQRRGRAIASLPFPQTAPANGPRPLRAWLQRAVERGFIEPTPDMPFEDWLWTQEVDKEAIAEFGYRTDADGWVAFLTTELGMRMHIAANVPLRLGVCGGERLGFAGLEALGLGLVATGGGCELRRMSGSILDPVRLTLNAREVPLGAVVAELSEELVRRGALPLECDAVLRDTTIILGVDAMLADEVIRFLAKVSGGTVERTRERIFIRAP